MWVPWTSIFQILEFEIFTFSKFLKENFEIGRLGADSCWGVISQSSCCGVKNRSTLLFWKQVVPRKLLLRIIYFNGASGIMITKNTSELTSHIARFLCYLNIREQLIMLQGFNQHIIFHFSFFETSNKWKSLRFFQFFRKLAPTRDQMWFYFSQMILALEIFKSIRQARLYRRQISTGLVTKGLILR